MGFRAGHRVLAVCGAAFLLAWSHAAGARAGTAGEYRDVIIRRGKPPITKVRVTEDSWVNVKYRRPRDRESQSLPATDVTRVRYGGAPPQLEQALRLYAQNPPQYARARVAFKALAANTSIRKKPQIYQYVSYYYGRCLLRTARSRNEFMEARKLFGALAAKGSRSRFFFDAYLARSEAYIRMGNYSGALRELERAERAFRELSRNVTGPVRKHVTRMMYKAAYLQAEVALDGGNLEKSKSLLETLRADQEVPADIRQQIQKQLVGIAKDGVFYGRKGKSLVWAAKRAIASGNDAIAAKACSNLADFCRSVARDYSRARWWYLEVAVRFATSDSDRANAYLQAGKCCEKLMAPKDTPAKIRRYYREQALLHYRTVCEEFPKASAAREAREARNRLGGRR